MTTSHQQPDFNVDGDDGDDGDGDDGDDGDDDDDDEDNADDKEVSNAFAYVVNDDSHIENPNLFSETYAMAVASAAIFPMAEVREAARTNKIDAPEIITLPVKTMTIIGTFTKYQNELQTLLKRADYEFLVEFKASMDEQEHFNGTLLSTIVGASTVHYFGDDDSKTECVYLIFQNPILKRILVCFRGSITITDWMKDSKVVVGDIRNPLHMRSDQRSTLGIHLGFREYLYSTSKNASYQNYSDSVTEMVRSLAKRICRDRSQNESSLHDNEHVDDIEGDKELQGGQTLSIIERPQNDNKNSVGSNTTSTNSNNSLKQSKSSDTTTSSASTSSGGRSRLDRIMEELQDLRQGNEDYRIYVTGHSLGGALALLASLEVAAAMGRPDCPVTFVGIGNPRAATVAFRSVVETLETEGKLRCLGVHNHMDLVPMIPNSALSVRQHRRFCQVGFELLVDGITGDSFEIRYCPQQYNGMFSHFMEISTRGSLALLQAPKIAGRHHYLTYMKLLRGLEKPLSKLYLNDYYNAIVQPGMYPGSEAMCTEAKLTSGDWRDWE